MELLVAPVVLVALVLFVAWPLLKERPDPALAEKASALDSALAEKEYALSNLKDIEMDFRMGKLSEEDYGRLREEWEVMAVAALEKVESVQQPKSSRRSSK